MRCRREWGYKDCRKCVLILLRQKGDGLPRATGVGGAVFRDVLPSAGVRSRFQGQVAAASVGVTNMSSY